MPNIAIGVDIGGSHITCQQVDIESNKPLAGTLVREAVDNSAGKDEILVSWISAIKQTAGNIDVKNYAGIGFAMPGPFDYSNGIAKFDEKVKKFANLYNVNVARELQALLGVNEKYPIRFMNDASCFAVGESLYGRASDYKKILALTLGTGFGTTFIENHLPVLGRAGIPDDGFLYHIPFKDSIADDYFSTRWFVRTYHKKTGKLTEGVKEIGERAGEEPAAKALFEEFGTSLGEFLNPFIENFDCECIVLGGNISKSFPLFQSALKNALQDKRLVLLPSSLEEQAPIIGSARLCDQQFYTKLTL